MYFYNHLEEDDKYPVFIDGNHAMTRIKNTNAAGGKILLVKDSFSHCLAPFLAENYSDVILVRYALLQKQHFRTCTAEKPDNILVLYGIDNIATVPTLRGCRKMINSGKIDTRLFSRVFIFAWINFNIFSIKLLFYEIFML